MSENNKTQNKKVYRGPVLQSYGDIRAITQAVTTTGTGDGAMTGSAKKT